MVIAAGFPIGGDGLSLSQGIISRIKVRSYAHSDKDLRNGASSCSNVEGSRTLAAT